MKTLIAVALTAAFAAALPSYAADTANSANSAAVDAVNQSIDIDSTSLEKTSPFETPTPQAAQGGAKAFRDAPLETPAVIPHDISQYKINADVNMCLLCHGLDNQGEKQNNLPYTMPASHWKLVNGKREVAPDRYPCLICHAPQTHAEPLVPTTDEGHP